jgi:DNA-binding MarR family transcriptional regulator
MPTDDPHDLAPAVRTVARLARALECGLTDLSMAQYRVLAAVADGGERATHLAHGLAVAKPTVTAAVDGLVERGLLVRQPVPGDRRAVRISLTAAGRAALAQAEAGMAERLAGVLERTAARTAVLRALDALGPALDRPLPGRVPA